MQEIYWSGQTWEAVFYEDKTNEITVMEVNNEIYMRFKIGMNVTATSAEPYRIATMIGVTDPS